MCESQKQPIALTNFDHINTLQAIQDNDPFPIIPFSQAPKGTLHLPGSKSITNRALILAALSSNRIEIHNALISEDTLIMVEALKALGFAIEVNINDISDTKIIVQGLCGHIPKDQAKLNIGNAGTAARFLPALLSLHPAGLYHIDCSPAMRKRPIKPLLDALVSLGAVTIFYHEREGHFPLTIKTHGMQDGTVFIDNSQTSQVLSGILMIAPFAPNFLKIHFASKITSWPFVEMTLKMMDIFSPWSMPAVENNTIHFTHKGCYALASKDYFVEPDATAASYFFALIFILGGQLNIPELSLKNTLQGDLDFARILQSLGLNIKEFANELNIERGTSAQLVGLSYNFEAFSDTFLTLAAIAPLLKGPTVISGISHTRLQETDRLSAMAQELRKLNQQIIEKNDSLTIIPQPLKPAIIETYEDHRIAMSFAILGSYDLMQTGEPWLSIRNPSCCAKTFPNFFDTLNKLKSYPQNILKPELGITK